MCKCNVCLSTVRVCHSVFEVYIFIVERCGIRQHIGSLDSACQRPQGTWLWVMSPCVVSGGKSPSDRVRPALPCANAVWNLTEESCIRVVCDYFKQCKCSLGRMITNSAIECIHWFCGQNYSRRVRKHGFAAVNWTWFWLCIVNKKVAVQKVLLIWLWSLTRLT